MLKKFSDYINNNVDQEKKKSSLDYTIEKKTEIKPIKQNKIIERKVVSENNKNNNIENEKNLIKFDGKTVTFSKNIKPSEIILVLEKKKISKEKLHFIINEQLDSIIILKYNLNTKIKLKLFVETLINYHKDDVKYTKLFEGIECDGSDTYAIIKNIPKDIKSIIIENLKQLLR